MIFHSYIPRPPLSDFVALFWLYEGYAQPHARERVLPDGSVELVVSLAEVESQVYERGAMSGRTFRNGVMAGARSEFLVIDTASQASGASRSPARAIAFSATRHASGAAAKSRAHSARSAWTADDRASRAKRPVSSSRSAGVRDQECADEAAEGAVGRHRVGR